MIINKKIWEVGAELRSWPERFKQASPVMYLRLFVELTSWKDNSLETLNAWKESFMLPKEAIQEFKQLYKKIYQIDLSNEKARIQAEHFLCLFSPEAQKQKGHNEK